MNNPELRLYQTGQSARREIQRQNPLLGGMIDRTGSAAAATALSLYAFGCTFSGLVVTVAAGEIHHGVRTPVVVATADKTITADHQYIAVEYIFATGAGSIGAPTVSRPQSESTTYRCWLAQFRLVDGVVSIEQIGHIGNVIIPGAFA